MENPFDTTPDDPNTLTDNEKWAVKEAINHAIAYRLNNQTRLSDIKDLRGAKKKLGMLEKTKQKRRDDA